MRQFFHSLIRGAEERPRRAVAVGVLAMLLGLAAAITLRPGTAVEDMLPEASPSAEAIGRVLADFRLIDDLVLVVDPPEGAAAGAMDLEAEARRLAERLAVRLAGDERVGRVRAVAGAADAAADGASVRAYAAAHGGWLLGDAERAALAAALEPGELAAALGRFRERLAAAGAEAGGVSADDPLGLLPLLLGDGGAAARRSPASRGSGGPPLIRIAGTRPANDLPYASFFVDAVTDAADAANDRGLVLTLTGAHAIADFTARSVRGDMVISLVVTMVSLSVLFLLIYRSGRTLPLLLATVNGGLVIAFGIYALLGGSLSPVTAVCGAVLAGLGIDYGVHLLAARRFGDAAALPTSEGDAEAAAGVGAGAAARVAGTLVAACVTSCVGFGAVALAGVRALSEFAVLGVLGLVATLGMTLLFLPAALRLAGHERAARPRLDPSPLVRRVLARPRPPLFAVSALFGMVAAVLVLGGEVRFADDLEAMHARPNPPLEAQERLAAGSMEEAGEDAEHGPGHLLVLVTADPLDAGSLAERTRAAEAALRALAEEPGSGVSAVVGPGRFLPRAAGRPRVPLPTAADALARFDAAARGAGLAPAGFAGFRTTLAALLEPGPPPTRVDLDGTPAGRLLPRVDPADPDAAPDAALVLVGLSAAWELLPDRPATLAAVRGAIAPVPGATATGLAVVGADMQARIAAVLPRLLAVAGLAVVFWLAVVFRNPWDVFLALSPAVAGIAAVFAAVVATGTQLHAANLIALPLTLGLGVDDGIFLVHLARGVRRASETPTAGVTPATLEAAAAAPVHAVLVTSITTIAAFGSLWFTRSPAIASLGLLSAVGVSACLLVSVFGLLPALALQQRWLLERRLRRRGGGGGGGGSDDGA